MFKYLFIAVVVFIATLYLLSWEYNKYIKPTNQVVRAEVKSLATDSTTIFIYTHKAYEYQDAELLVNNMKLIVEHVPLDTLLAKCQDYRLALNGPKVPTAFHVWSKYIDGEFKCEPNWS